MAWDYLLPRCMEETPRSPPALRGNRVFPFPTVRGGKGRECKARGQTCKWGSLPLPWHWAGAGLQSGHLLLMQTWSKESTRGRLHQRDILQFWKVLNFLSALKAILLQTCNPFILHHTVPRAFPPGPGWTAPWSKEGPAWPCHCPCHRGTRRHCSFINALLVPVRKGP